MLTYHRDYSALIHQTVKQRKSSIKIFESSEKSMSVITSSTEDDPREIVEIKNNSTESKSLTKKGGNIPRKLESHYETPEKEAEFHMDGMLHRNEATVEKRFF